ncbi:hypothetical protein ACEPAH_3971 [Sanghuangporus vaninii]
MGLDKLEFDADMEANLSFQNFPLVLSQVSELDPAMSRPDDSTRKLTEIGTISPDSRRFALAQGMSSISQFRAVDYGFENCSLSIALQSDPSQEVFSHGMLVDIWALDGSSKLDPGHLSWNSRPRRKLLLESVEFRQNVTISLRQNWICKWGSMQTFEFVCSNQSRTCFADFWQNPKDPALGMVASIDYKCLCLILWSPSGVTMIQRSTLGGHSQSD